MHRYVKKNSKTAQSSLKQEGRNTLRTQDLRVLLCAVLEFFFYVSMHRKYSQASGCRYAPCSLARLCYVGSRSVLVSLLSQKRMGACAFLGSKDHVLPTFIRSLLRPANLTQYKLIKTCHAHQYNLYTTCSHPTILVW